MTTEILDPKCHKASFTPDEIQVLDYIVQAILRGGTPAIAMRSKYFASVARKVIALKAATKESG